MDLTPARREIVTERLLLQAGDASLADSLADFYRRNRRHFAPWDPPTAESFYTAPAQAERVRLGLKAFAEGTGFRYWLSPADDPQRVIGSVHFSQVSRGAFHSCVLGYALDERCQGRGLMHEALSAAIEEMFSPLVNLHRIQAAYRPENKRSGAVLSRLGFRIEGLAKDYLFIDGAWRDHQLTALTNPTFNEPADW
ncbi:MAG TPA: GNAT family N-acetyltransferase [Ideonella sp.]|uniref:GNAT family N-acetyltransferase n=1 Tax=Ideonella sp. TaxID=1929293 RepID=UPI002E31E8B3|nr:GNAT family N-acetyltransferase [Ideonella sp.]HEX5684112.1 GNAT family N-acetyltransferase [Ideonella sp.]